MKPNRADELSERLTPPARAHSKPCQEYKSIRAEYMAAQVRPCDTFRIRCWGSLLQYALVANRSLCIESRKIQQQWKQREEIHLIWLQSHKCIQDNHSTDLLQPSAASLEPEDLGPDGLIRLWNCLPSLSDLQYSDQRSHHQPLMSHHQFMSAHDELLTQRSCHRH
jgi:hypothetical protein